MITLVFTTVSFISKTNISAQEKKPVWVFVGTYTEKEPHVDGKAEGIYIYEMNPVNGALTHVVTSPKTINPSYVVLHPNGKWLYAVNETSDGKVSAFSIDRENKKLKLLNIVSSQGSDPCYVSVDKTGKFVMVANYSSGTVALYPINADGSLKEASSVVKHEGKGPDANRQKGPHAHMIIPGPGQFIYSADLGTDQVISYTIDAKNTKLVKATTYTSKPGAGPRHLAFHNNKKWAYVVTELNGTIESCNIDAKTGALKRFQEISTLLPEVKLPAGCADIHIHPNGKYLYASNRGEVNTIAIYAIDQATGKLTAIEQVSVKGRTPRSFAIDPTGTFLLAANQDSGNVITFRIDAATGKLKYEGVEAKIPTPVCLRFE